jgi:hypothetical protein
VGVNIGKAANGPGGDRSDQADIPSLSQYLTNQRTTSETIAQTDPAYSNPINSWMRYRLLTVSRPLPNKENNESTMRKNLTAKNHTDVMFQKQRCTRTSRNQVASSQTTKNPFPRYIGRENHQTSRKSYFQEKE